MSKRPDLERELAKLKGFQRRTADYAFERLYLSEGSSRRFLVADEVGLGKTLVARGVIAKTLDHLWDKVDRIDIVYICSNGSIARQNVRRLSLLPQEDTHQVDRLTLLPSSVHGLRNRKVNFVAFTPGTSFDLKSSGGLWKERIVLYWMLQSLWPDERTGPKNLMQGWVQDTRWFRRQLQSFREKQTLDAGLRKALKHAVRRRIQEEKKRREPTLQQRYQDLCRRFRKTKKHVSKADRHDQSQFLGDMRNLLAATCIEALEPDLVILDEFQRFRYLLQPNDEAGALAQGLFEYSDEASAVRILLLSATPYKMYTLQHEQAEDDHYEDFLKTFEFISGGGERHESLRNLLQEYRRELYRLGNEGDSSRLEELKTQTEACLRRHMCRTERIRPTEDKDGMLRDVPTEHVDLHASDVTAFSKLETVAEAVGQPGVVEYWKSAPYLLSFMDQYKLKQDVVKAIEPSKSELRQTLAEAPELFVNWQEFERYHRLDPQNARLRWLARWLDTTGAWQLLWLPPTLPYWSLVGPFAQAQNRNLTKQLIFSSWNVVPKAVASMVSYEVERRVFNGAESRPRNSSAARKRRRPLLRFARSSGRLTGMPVLGLLYPSVTLSRLVHLPQTVNTPSRTLADTLTNAEQALHSRIEALVRSHAGEDGREDEAWYWAAPILLDLQEAEESTRQWFERPDLPALWSTGGNVQEDDEDGENADQRWVDHVQEACALARGEVTLGAPPADLVAVLAKLAVASPGVTAARALARQGLGGIPLQGLPLRDAAASVAWAFRSLFNQPEAMALVRTGRGDMPYWQMVLDYAAEGCLQAVLDEHAHLVRDLEGLIDKSAEETVAGVSAAIIQVLTLRTSTAQVDELHLDASTKRDLISHRRVRNHFALRFASQETEDGRAGARIEHVRASFNSPFWPFVLTTTSVGQEGLDFHAYSHAVVHWNLPSNPVDLEQREGRVHRYKGHAVRKNVAGKHGKDALANAREDVWERLFALAVEHDGDNGHGLVPYWLFPGEAAIERHVPALPLSREIAHLESLKRSLAVYRMVFGQPRQDDLMAYLLDRLGEESLSGLAPSLQIDLSPKLQADHDYT